MFGKPTTLPWGLEISPAHRPIGYEQYATFHPTFLYESLYCVALVGILLLAERRLSLKQGQTFALYVILYTFGRFWFENLRIDPAHDIGPLRVNAWVSVALFAFGIWWFWWLGRHEPRQQQPRAHASPDASSEPGVTDRTARVSRSSTRKESP